MGAEVAYAAIVAVSAYYSYEQQQEAQEEMLEAAEERTELEQKREDINVARERARQVRQARAQRATALAQAQTGAGTGGSGLVGAQANINNAATGNLAFLGQQREISRSISDLNISSAAKVSKYNQRAARGQMVGTIAGAGYDLSKE